MTKLNDVISRITRRHSQACLQQQDEEDDTIDTKTSSVEDGALHPNGEGEGQGSDQPHMKQCLTTFDLVSLGVGSCLGTGMYLTAGLVASTMTGPGGVVSIFVAGLFSMLTGLCYAELAGLCPKTSGSAYMYAYITLGEFSAFVIGWGLVVEYVIGTAAGAVALSETLSSLSNGVLETFMEYVAHALGLPKLDLVAAAICLMLTLLLASGAEMSAKVNNALNISNMAVLLFFFGASMVLGSGRNWVMGGFFPFGLSGQPHLRGNGVTGNGVAVLFFSPDAVPFFSLLYCDALPCPFLSCPVLWCCLICLFGSYFSPQIVRAVPTCYFAYIGFDTVAATGAEAQDPRHSVPRSLLLSIAINCISYTVVISCLTYCLPFYLLHHDTALTDVFPQLNFPAGKYIVAVGAVSGEFAATFGSMFPLPRVLSAMAGDGLVFRPLAKICPKRRTPVRATLLSGFVAMVMSTFFDLGLLIELVLIGTLLAYVMVTFALLFMRYVLQERNVVSAEPVSVSPSGPMARGQRSDGDAETEPLMEKDSDSDDSLTVFRRRSNSPRNQPSISRSNLSTTEEKTVSENLMNKPKQNPHDTKHQSQTTHQQNQNVSSTSKFSIKRTPQHSRRTKMFSESTSSAVPKSTKHTRTKSDSSSANSTDRQPLLEGSSSEEECGPRNGRDSIVDDNSIDTLRRNTAGGNIIRYEELIENPEYGGDLVSSRTILEKEQCSQITNKLRLSTTSWLKAITDFADKISLSHRRTISLLGTIYGVGTLLCFVVSIHWTRMANGSVIALGFLGVLSAILIVLVGVVCFMRENPKGDEFRAPLVPALPVLVALFNVHLMTSLSLMAWALFSIWMVFGLCIYFCYGMQHSSAGDHISYQLISSTEVSLAMEEMSDRLETRQ